MSRIENIQQTSAGTTSDKQQEKKQPTLKQRAPWMESIASKPLEAPAVQDAAKPETAPTINPYVGKTADQVIDEGQFNATQYWQIQDEAIRKGQRNPYTLEEIVSRVRTQDPLYETAEQKAKRERTEKAQRAITGVSDLISNVANLAYTAQGAVPVVVDNYTPLNERQKAIQDKRDVLKRQYDSMLAGAQKGEIAYQRSLQAAREKAAMEQAYKERELALKDAYKKGQIETQAELDRKLKELELQFRGWINERNISSREKEGAANRANSWAIAQERNGNDKYAVSFVGNNGVYRFKDKDISYGKASYLMNVIKDLAQKRVKEQIATDADQDALNYLNNSLFDSNNKDQVLEFVRQNISRYPEVEEMLVNDPDVVIQSNSNNPQTNGVPNMNFYQSLMPQYQGPYRPDYDTGTRKEPL